MEMARLDLDSLLNVFPTEFLDLTVEEQRVSLQLYRLLAEGQPVSRKRLADALNLSIQDVETIVWRWPGVYDDDGGRIVGYWGLALPEMDHRFEVGGQRLYTWCAWDSLFIPQILQTTARVESRCPETGCTIQLTVGPEGVEYLDPADIVMSFVVPDESKLRQDVIQHFCHYVHFFHSKEAGERWISQHPGVVLLSIEDAFELGRKKNAIQYRGLYDSLSENRACGISHCNGQE